MERLESSKPNHVIVLTITNVRDELNINVIYEICQPHGNVKRIAIIQRDTCFQALVEFDDARMAKMARDQLHGCEIFENSCSLRAEFSSVERVRVFSNDARHWDYTKPLIEDFGRSGSRKRRFDEGTQDFYNAPPREALLPNYKRTRARSLIPTPPPLPRRYFLEVPYAIPPMDYRSGPPPPQSYPPPMRSIPPRRVSDYDRSHKVNGHEPSRVGGPVLMLYGIDQDHFNCDKLFNLFCVYGTCMRIKFLKNKTNTCMIEMGSAKEAALVTENLNGMELFKCKLFFEPSRQKSILSTEEPWQMPDHTSSFIDYSSNKNQRFADIKAARKNRIVPPNRQLYWFDAPPGITESGIQKIFQMKRSTVPMTVTKFNIKTAKVAVGTCDFESVEAATEALMLCNHAKVQLSQKSDTFILKLAYSGSFEGFKGSRSK
ncbi:hypothetical protein QR680_011844 [Steinernema hermaphroditum]|uniref:RRM domain-containing protein n=1 Tax=Steinernema hermaphroditum TaxID=289476 RepID=A0AA39HZX6_9BILA|nr:hypothetical protein QR680_011844 [Steinernema hermaphroditum]